SLGGRRVGRGPSRVSNVTRGRVRRPRLPGRRRGTIITSRDQSLEEPPMCRNIKTLANFAPPATDDEIHASALQFVRKLSGTAKPSKANEAAFDRAVLEVTESARRLIDSLVTTAAPRDRVEEARKGRERSIKRFGPRPEARSASA